MEWECDVTDFTESFRKSVETRFKSEFGILYPDTAMEFDDVPFEQPKDGPWASFTFRQNAAKQTSIGRKFVVRTTGFIQIDIMYPAEKGRTKFRKMAEAAADIFAYRKFKGDVISITCDEKHVDAAPSTGSFKRIMARVFFHYDGELERRSIQEIS